MSPDLEFDVFLSHNSKDKPAIRELADALEDRGVRVWLDERELIPGRPWQEELEPKLPLFLQAFTWVDLRGGLTSAGLRSCCTRKPCMRRPNR
jgi:proline dehydrogenase